MATLALTAQDFATLIGRLAAPTVGAVRAEVTAEHLRVFLLNLDVPMLRRGVVLLVRGSVDERNVLRLNIAVERAGFLTPVIRLFLGPLLRRLVTRLGAGEVAEVESRHEVIIRLDQLVVGGERLGEWVDVSALTLPAAPCVLSCDFLVNPPANPRSVPWTPASNSTPPRSPTSSAAPG